MRTVGSAVTTDGGTANGDGGGESTPDADLSEIEHAIDALRGLTHALGGSVDDVQSDLAYAGAAIDALDERVDELDDRVTSLEPCEGEAFISDATERMVELVRPIIVAACEASDSASIALDGEAIVIGAVGIDVDGILDVPESARRLRLPLNLEP